MTRTTKTTTRKPTYVTNTNAKGAKTGVSNNSRGTKTTVVKNAAGTTYTKVTNAAGKTFTKATDSKGNVIKPKVTAKVVVKATPKVTPKVAATKPLANNKVKMATAVPTDKFSEKVYPIYQTPTAKNRRENTLNFAADAANNKKPFKEQDIMYGTKAQADSSRASVYKMNLKNFSGTNLPVYPDKNNPYVPPGNTGAGPLVKRKFVTNNAQLRANKRLTGKTGDER